MQMYSYVAHEFKYPVEKGEGRGRGEGTQMCKKLTVRLVLNVS